ncbi:MAG: hypothetical protein IPK74_00860 [Deltaproteobacteria bacterium]|nr:hypothetical protein [Deltaproteobacteria bacterium]
MFVALTSACVVENPAWIGNGPQTSSAGTSGSGDPTSGGTQGTTTTAESTPTDPDTGPDDTGPDPDMGVPMPSGCEPLPPPRGNIVEIASSDALVTAVAAATPGDTLVLAPGTYAVEAPLVFDVADVTLRSQSGEPDDTVLDLGGLTTSAIEIAASDVTIAELGIRNAGGRMIVVAASDRTLIGTTLYRLALVDGFDLMVEVTGNSAGTVFADAGEIACSTFTISDDFRPDGAGGCEVGAISGRGIADWTIRDNTFSNFWCPTGQARTVVRLFGGSHRSQVERNLFVDNWKSLVLGDGGPTDLPEPVCEEAYMPYRTSEEPDCGGYWGHVGGVVVNNRVWVGGPGISVVPKVDTGIALACACDTDVLHNTVVNLGMTTGSIEWRYTRTRARVANNYCTDQLWERNPAAITLASSNVQFGSPNVFVAPLEPLPALDLHLAPGIDGAVDIGFALPDPGVPEDFEHDGRDRLPDAGADELVR